MGANKTKVLLIREGRMTWSPLTDRLGESECECCFAVSVREVDELLGKHDFDLVLAPLRLKSDSLYPLIGLLEGSRSTLFYSQAVEDGCWWLPALWRGLNCFGAPAFRPAEFATVLDATLKDIGYSRRMAEEAWIHIVPRRSVPAAKPPYPRRVSRMELPVSPKSSSLALLKALK
jgi:hypothetical protein